MRPIAVLALSAVACSRAGSGFVEAAPPVVADAGRELGHAASDPVELALCGGRTDCRLESELWQAGARGGSRSVVAVVQQSPGPRRSGLGPFQFGPSPVPEAPAPCAAWETWLTTVASGRAAPVQLLASDCPTGKRPPLLVDLGDARIRYTLGDDAVPSDEYEIALAPPRVEREIHRGRGGALGWDYGAYRGEICEQQECSPVPLQVTVADSFSREGWKTTGLGECAMLVDGTGTVGEMSHGELVHDGTSSVRLLLSGGTLYIEVEDDAFVTKGALVDTLVFYSTSAEAMPGYRSRIARLGMDGRLTDWEGHVRQVETAAGATTRRFAVTDLWPGPDGLWRMAYEDTDDGRTLGPGQSTGKVSKEPWLFASPFSCVSRDGALHLDRKLVVDAETPIVP
jgi:hypothetical protein